MKKELIAMRFVIDTYFDTNIDLKEKIYIKLMKLSKNLPDLQLNEVKDLELKEEYDILNYMTLEDFMDLLENRFKGFIYYADLYNQQY